MATGIRSNGFTENPTNPVNSVGKQMVTTFYKKTIATGAGTNTLHILGGPYTYDCTIRSIKGATPALTSASDNDLGFWKMEADGSFTEIDADVLWDGVTLASALTYRDLLQHFSTADLDDSIGTLLGKGSDQMPIGGVYLGLLIKTASTAASEVLYLEVDVEQGNS